MKPFLLLAAGVLLTGPFEASAAPILYSVQSNSNDHLYSIDAATGVATDLGALSFTDAEGLAFVGNTLFAIGGNEEQFWNITTPPGSLIGSTGTRDGVDAGLDYNSANGTMYNIQSQSSGSWLYTINLVTGAATLVGSNSVFSDGLAIDSDGNAFAIDGIFANSLYSLNLGTGAATLIGGLGLGNISVQFGLTFADGLLYGLSSAGNIYTINTATGAATLAASTTCGGVACDGWEGLAAPTSVSVPEPGTLAILGLGLAGLAVARRRKQ